MKKILFINDFSNASKNALTYAKHLANITKSQIISYNPLTSHNKLNKIELAIDENLCEDKTEYLSYSNNENTKLVINEDAIIKEILLIENNENIDLVIIGINYGDKVGESIFKNIGINLMKETIVPLLVVPDKTIYSKIKSIAFAVDFILDNEIIMHKTIKDFLSCVNPKIIVLNVVKENAEIMTDRIVSEKNIEKYFENENHIYSFIENNDLILGLKDFISCNNIDMITMIPHKHNFLQNMFVRSKTNEMLNNTSIPLIVFPIDK